MNCISGSSLLICLFACTACGIPASEVAAAGASSGYSVHFAVTPEPHEGSVAVTMTVQQTRGQLRELSFTIVDGRTSGITGDGILQVSENEVQWQPGRAGGKLSWRTRVQHQRGDKGHDAWLDNNWGVFRAEDIIPRARTRTLKGAKSTTSMSFEMTSGWSVVTEYATLQGRIAVQNPQRRFDQPRGWIAMGRLGVRRETIAGIKIAVAAPHGQSVRRMDMLALLNWTLPELTAVLPESIERLTIVSAGDPMWRGGLSAPASIYIHADRPLISENATSTLVHEVIHVAMNISAARGFDWIVEGLAEYYSLELLRRGGAITASRYRRALERQAAWARDATALCAARSSGARTALAVVTFRYLDKELQDSSANKRNLDNVLAVVAADPAPVTLRALQESVAEILQKPSAVLKTRKLPGCQQYMPTPEA